MAVKSELKSTSPRAAPTYPRLMATDSFVVLMNADGSGTVVGQKDFRSPYNIGHYATGWTLGSFVPFTGTVMLSNEDAG